MDNQSSFIRKPMGMTKLAEIRKAIADFLTQPVARALAKTPIAPNAITWLGFLITVGATVLIVTGRLFAAGWVVLVAGFFDILDGALARRTNQVTQFGAVLDSTLDRLADAILILGILIWYVLNANDYLVIVVLLAGTSLIGSFLVSYVRARAEGLGLQCEVGFLTRAERVVVLALGLLLNQLLLALAVLTVFSFITVSQRLLHVWRKTKIK